MTDINDITLSGHLTSDPELKILPGTDTAVLNFRIGVNGYKDSSYFFSCQVWGKYAEALGAVLSKGMFVCVQGEVQPYEYESPKGKQYGIRIRCNRVVHGGKTKVDMEVFKEAIALILEETTLDTQINNEDLSEMTL